MIASGQTLRKLQPLIPFCKRTRFNGMTYGVGPAGYDVRIDQDVILPPGGFALASTIEEFDMPLDLLGIVHDKSTWARLGLTVQNTVLEPGWKGFLTLELTNHNPPVPWWKFRDREKGVIRIARGTPIAQIIFHYTDEPVERGYSGKYQHQKRGPQEAILET